MFGNNNEIDSPIWKDETSSNKMVEEVDKMHNEFPENTEHSFLQAWNPPFLRNPPPPFLGTPFSEANLKNYHLLSESHPNWGLQIV